MHLPNIQQVDGSLIKKEYLLMKNNHNYVGKILRIKKLGK
jgi:hypothetical protein